MARFNTKRKLKGSVLGFSVMLLSLFLFSGITVLSISVLERKASFTTQKSIIAFQGADSGAERVLKRIYIDNSPTIAVVALRSPMPTDTTLTTLASNLCSGGSATCSGASCSGGTISATNAPASSPGYVFSVTFYEESGATIACGDNQWRDKVIRVRAEGVYQRTSRVLEVGIRPRM
ncbi:MAG: hypothetical protein ACEQSB_02200 [Undibacterium sp.]